MAYSTSLRVSFDLRVSIFFLYRLGLWLGGFPAKICISLIRRTNDEVTSRSEPSKCPGALVTVNPFPHQDKQG